MSTPDAYRSLLGLVRAEWEDHVAPFRWAWFSLLLTGGPGSYLGHRSLGRYRRCCLTRSTERLPETREHREVGVKLSASDGLDA